MKKKWQEKRLKLTMDGRRAVVGINTGDQVLVRYVSEFKKQKIVKLLMNEHLLRQ